MIGPTFLQKPRVEYKRFMEKLKYKSAAGRKLKKSAEQPVLSDEKL